MFQLSKGFPSKQEYVYGIATTDSEPSPDKICLPKPTQNASSLLHDLFHRDQPTKPTVCQPMYPFPNFLGTNRKKKWLSTYFLLCQQIIQPHIAPVHDITIRKETITTYRRLQSEIQKSYIPYKHCFLCMFNIRWIHTGCMSFIFVLYLYICIFYMFFLLTSTISHQHFSLHGGCVNPWCQECDFQRLNTRFHT